MQRRANDAQVDRFLSAIKRDLSYRQQIAARLANEKLRATGSRIPRGKTLQSTTEYKSAMRRLQRYVTEAGEKRSFERAPKQYQAETRRVYRSEPPPPPPPEPIQARPIYRPEPEPPPRIEREREPVYLEWEGEPEHTDLYELQSIIAFFDGDIYEAADRLGVRPALLDLATQGIAPTRRTGAGQVDEGVEALYDELSSEERQDIQDFSDLFHNLPDWEIKLILDDIASGETSFADWIDAWHNDGMDLEDVSHSEYWALWRAAYKRSKG